MKRFVWEPAAQADLRRIPQAQALAILHAMTDFGRGKGGDVRKLVADRLGRYRLRVGDWRVLFKLESDNTLRIYSVENRKEAYR